MTVCANEVKTQRPSMMVLRFGTAIRVEK